MCVVGYKSYDFDRLERASYNILFVGIGVTFKMVISDAHGYS